MKSIPLETFTKVGHVSPNIQIGSDLYTLSKSTFLNRIVGVTITTPVPAVVQYCCDAVKLIVLEIDVLFTLSKASILT